MALCNWTDTLLAAELGITRETIFRWRTGRIKSPKYEMVIKCIELFDLTPLERHEFLTAARLPDPNAKLLQVPKKPEDATHDNLPMPVTTGPVPPNNFLGRKDILADISNTWYNIPLKHIAIMGPKRSGKSSLLKYLHSGRQQIAQINKWVYIDFDDPRMLHLERLLRYILNELQLNKDDCDLATFTDILEKQLEGGTIILMDNVEIGFTQLDEIFWRHLRFLGNHLSHLGFCVSFTSKTEESKKFMDSAFFNLFKEINLGPLSKEEAIALIKSMPQSFTKSEIDWLLECTNGWPAVIQQLSEVRYNSNIQKNRSENSGLREWQKTGLEIIKARYKHLWELEPNTNKPVNLSQWLQNYFVEAIESGWQKLELIFGKSAPVTAFRSAAVKRAKLIELGEAQKMVQVIELEEEPHNQEIKVTLRLRSINETKPSYFPENLFFIVTPESGQANEMVSGQGKDYLEQVWFFESGETFKIKIQLDDKNVVEKFEL